MYMLNLGTLAYVDASKKSLTGWRPGVVRSRPPAVPPVTNGVFARPRRRWGTGR
jgi:hypothetical protein